MRHVLSNGVALRVEEVGHGSPLLLIMGLGASLDTWIAQRDAFAPHHRVILFDNLYLSREIAAAIPGARLTVLPRGNHAVQIEDAESFNGAVLEFLAGERKNPDGHCGDAPPRR